MPVRVANFFKILAEKSGVKHFLLPYAPVVALRTIIASTASARITREAEMEFDILSVFGAVSSG